MEMWDPDCGEIDVMLSVFEDIQQELRMEGEHVSNKHVTAKKLHSVNRYIPVLILCKMYGRRKGLQRITSVTAGQSLIFLPIGKGHFSTAACTQYLLTVPIK